MTEDFAASAGARADAAKRTRGPRGGDASHQGPTRGARPAGGDVHLPGGDARLPGARQHLYSLSDVTFQSIRDASFIGLENYRAQIASDRFWQAMGFSLQFAVISTVAQMALALVLVVALHPLLLKRPWLTALLMLPMMISPALMGVMYGWC